MTLDAECNTSRKNSSSPSDIALPGTESLRGLAWRLW
jgi:hypothetical protein